MGPYEPKVSATVAPVATLLMEMAPRYGPRAFTSGHGQARGHLQSSQPSTAMLLLGTLGPGCYSVSSEKRDVTWEQTFHQSRNKNIYPMPHSAQMGWFSDHMFQISLREMIWEEHKGVALPHGRWKYSQKYYVEIVIWIKFLPSDVCGLENTLILRSVIYCHIL